MDLNLDGLLDAETETAARRRARHDEADADAEVGPSPSSSSKRSGNAGTGRHAGGRTGPLLVQVVLLHRFPRSDKTHHDDDKRSSGSRK